MSGRLAWERDLGWKVYKRVLVERDALAAEVEQLRAALLRGMIPEGHPEARCELCGRENIVWFAPSEAWNEVTAAVDPIRERGVVWCPVCFSELAEQHGWHITGFAAEVERRDAPFLQDTAMSDRRWDGDPSSLRIDQLTAERDALAAEVERLREERDYFQSRLVDFSAAQQAEFGRAEALAAEVEQLREFWEARWAVEVGITDFDLHAKAVARLERADAALIARYGAPAVLGVAAGAAE